MESAVVEGVLLLSVARSVVVVVAAPAPVRSLVTALREPRHSGWAVLAVMGEQPVQQAWIQAAPVGRSRSSPCGIWALPTSTAAAAQPHLRRQTLAVVGGVVPPGRPRAGSRMRPGRAAVAGVEEVCSWSWHAP